MKTGSGRDFLHEEEFENPQLKDCGNRLLQFFVPEKSSLYLFYQQAVITNQPLKKLGKQRSFPEILEN